MKYDDKGGKMTKDEFVKKYHRFRVEDRELAVTEAALANAEGIDDDYAVVTGFSDLGYCLMLASAASYGGEK